MVEENERIRQENVFLLNTEALQESGIGLRRGFRETIERWNCLLAGTEFAEKSLKFLMIKACGSSVVILQIEENGIAKKSNIGISDSGEWKESERFFQIGLRCRDETRIGGW